MVTVLSSQSLLDIAVQTAGSVESAVEIAVENNLSITEALQAGSELIAKGMSNQDIADYYKNKSLKPATWSTPGVDRLDGIGHMAIEINFIVA